MTDQSTEHPHAVSERIGPGSVSVTRIAPRRYEGLNERGATVAIGGAELEGEHFSPGELLKLALAGCVALSVDRVTSRRLGDDFAMTVWAHGRSDGESNRYQEIGEEVHDDGDQFFRVEKGRGEVLIDGVASKIKSDMAMIVPAGARHNIRNTGDKPLKLYTLYAPPEHRDGTVHATKGDAAAAHEHFDGKTTEA